MIKEYTYHLQVTYILESYILSFERISDVINILYHTSKLRSCSNLLMYLTSNVSSIRFNDLCKSLSDYSIFKYSTFIKS